MTQNDIINLTNIMLALRSQDSRIYTVGFHLYKFKNRKNKSMVTEVGTVVAFGGGVVIQKSVKGDLLCTLHVLFLIVDGVFSL